jgi:hypothetical protein
MSDDLIVSGGGSTAVAIDELFVDAARLARTEAITSDWLARVQAINRGLSDVDIGPRSPDGSNPGWNLTFAASCLGHARDRAGWLRTSLLEAAERYGATERFVDGLWRFGAALGAPWLGFVAPGLVVGGLIAGLGQAAGSSVLRLFGSDTTPLESWLAENRGLLSDPSFVRFVRLAADHADEFAAGAARMPLSPPLAVALGAPESASVMLGVAGLLGVLGGRVLVEGPTRVAPLAPDPAAASLGAVDRGRPGVALVDAPTGVGQLADRVPAGGSDAQIRIERYGDSEAPRWIVYVGGTVELGPVAGAQPFDMTSNLHGVADDAGIAAMQRLTGGDSGAGDRAVREAMRLSGVQPGDPVLAVGYSGGGIIAANLAADPELNTVGAVNLGGPVASAPVRDGVPILSLEHAEDIVPATGGAGHPVAERVTVERSVLTHDHEDRVALPAHALSRYRETAALVDESHEARLAGFRSLVGEFTGGGKGLAQEWVATREVSPSTGAR